MRPSPVVHAAHQRLVVIQVSEQCRHERIKAGRKADQCGDRCLANDGRLVLHRREECLRGIAGGPRSDLANAQQGGPADLDVRVSEQFEQRGHDRLLVNHGRGRARRLGGFGLAPSAGSPRAPGRCVGEGHQGTGRLEPHGCIRVLECPEKPLGHRTDRFRLSPGLDCIQGDDAQRLGGGAANGGNLVCEQWQ